MLIKNHDLPALVLPPEMQRLTNAALAEESGIADGMTRRFDFTVLQSMAHDLSRQPWGGAPRDLPPTLANLTNRTK